MLLPSPCAIFFFFNDTATTEIYTLPYTTLFRSIVDEFTGRLMEGRQWSDGLHQAVEAKEAVKIKEETQTLATIDRKSTRLNSSHGYISYAVFCLKKKKDGTQSLGQQRLVLLMRS